MSLAQDTAAPAGPVDSIVVVGGGAAGWSAAALLARSFHGAAPVKVRVLDLAVDETPVLAALPTSIGFHGRLGLPEAQILAGARGTFRLGTRFEGWSAPGAAAFEPFGAVGASLAGAPFQHALAAARSAGEAPRPEDYSLAAVAAALHRYAHPSDDPRSVLSTLSYGLHLETAGYVALLRTAAKALGVEALPGELAEVEIDGGKILALRLGSGERLAADLFVDATGAAARLLERLDPSFDDWSAGAPFEERLEVVRPSEEPPAPFSTLSAHVHGWLALLPLQGAMARTFAYTAAALDEAAARSEFAKLVGEDAAGAARFRKAPAGCRPRAWVGNCVAVGAAAGAPGRFDLDLHLAHSSAERLVAFVPTAGPAPMAAAEYNRLTAEEMERLRDYSLAPLRLNGRRGEPIWDRLRETAGTETLEYKIALFASRGRLALYEGEVFPEDSWVATLLANGVWPARHDVRMDIAPPGALQNQLRRMRTTIEAAARALPSHVQALAALTPAGRS